MIRVIPDQGAHGHFHVSLEKEGQAPIVADLAGLAEDLSAVLLTQLRTGESTRSLFSQIDGHQRLGISASSFKAVKHYFDETPDSKTGDDIRFIWELGVSIANRQRKK